MPRSPSRMLVGLAVGAVLLAVLAACGNDAKPADAKSQDAVPGTVVDATAFLDGLLAAVKDQTTARATLTVGTEISAEASIRYGAKPATDLSVEAFGQTIRLVQVDDLVYLQKSAEEKFVVLTQDDPSLAALGGGLSGVDPQQVLGGLSGAITEVRRIGPATIEDQELTRYAVTLDSTKLSSGLIGMVPGVSKSEDLVLDLYVDSNDLLQQVEAELGQNDLVLVVTDWGKPVEITAPPASEILKNQ